ncbi:hypothetical protein [Paracoccus shanxieyensis]|uniref:Uncharacterized protein n=1 Tax=Paracoccus shanxieyensis TaxID=2675752 RepID=A0A6L6J4B0_9RHOB|nr:hypothetical protein [Paracoccus shanxieyensis]MTH66721.1 hypothetical protein [Paracoccus shanxieyensis]MTH89954.1 hypothetical protein [Paracoccus shanxieyensis]
MSKRSPGLPQRPRGFWPTPKAAVAPLIPYLPADASYGEPCAGDGSLIGYLSDLWEGGRCVLALDLDPQGPGIDQGDALDLEFRPELWITNPPWPKIGQRGDPAISIIKHLAGIAPVWALLPWDFAANDYFGRVIHLCSDIVPIGRVSWMGNGTPGKDNCAWYNFSAQNRHPCTVRRRA